MTPPSEPSAGVITHARAVALEALAGPPAVDRVSEYYALESNYAGALYLGLPDTDPDRITVSDLFATSALSISIPARAARRLLMEPGGSDSVNAALRALPAKSLSEVDELDLQSMETFYRGVKQALRRADSTSSSAWVTASKIAARKRPALFPVRDTDVTTLLGTRESKDYRVDWLVFRDLMRQPDVLSGLKLIEQDLRERASEGTHLVETEPLRLLDVALWTFAKSRK